MQSPVHPELEMKKIVKFGVEIEYCPKSGGVWLDKGELEKIIKMIREEKEENYEDNAPQLDDSPRNENRRDYDNDYDDDDNYEDRDKGRNGRRPRKRRDSIFEEIFDIF